MNTLTTPHPQAGQTVMVTPAARLFGQAVLAPVEFTIEDWNDRVLGCSWADVDNHLVSISYAVRNAAGRLPLDNEVVYGHAYGLGHLIHVSEIDGGESR